MSHFIKIGNELVNLENVAVIKPEIGEILFNSASHSGWLASKRWTDIPMFKAALRPHLGHIDQSLFKDTQTKNDEIICD